MNFLSKLGKDGTAIGVSAVLSLVGLIIYIVSATTGFLAGQDVNALPIVFSILAILIDAVIMVKGDSLGSLIKGVLMIAVAALLAVIFAQFILARLTVFADVWFIPVNYPAAEGTALTASMTGIIFYILSFVAVAVAGFIGKKEN